jgi:diadenosine tetraphosphate (Ap4A) HIT family hydrolase
MVDHAYPSRLLGWLVLELRRHAEALHELSAEEMIEIGDLIRRSWQVLRDVTGCQKQYDALYAEAPHFAHLHIHIVPRAADLSEDLRGPRVFGLFTLEGAVPPEEIRARSEELRALPRVAWRQSFCRLVQRVWRA